MDQLNSLRLKLQRLKISNPTPTARWLFNNFRELSVLKFGSEEYKVVIAKRKGENFSTWRESLLKKGILSKQNSILEKNILAPGPWLIGELNKASKSVSVFATVQQIESKANKTDITELRVDVEILKIQVHEILETIKTLSQPPPSREKQLEIIRLTHQLQDLTKTKHPTLWDA